MLHADRGVVVDVAQLAHRVRACLRHRRRRQEVVRRRARRLEEQPLHRADAAVGPERQQHQRHRRAVVAVVARCSPTSPGRSRATDRRRSASSSARRRGTRCSTCLALVAPEVVARTTRRPIALVLVSVAVSGPHVYTALSVSACTSSLPPGSTWNIQPRTISTPSAGRPRRTWRRSQTLGERPRRPVADQVADASPSTSTTPTIINR